MNTVDVIVPVYRGKQSVQACVESLLASPQRTPFEIILIDDASPEPEVKEYLASFAGLHERVTLLENAENLGFVATVNRGMALHPDRDLVLLNSDTEVANDWLDRLVRCAHSDPRAGSVTPFSNNATICSFPRYCEGGPLPAHWSLEEIDGLFAEVNGGASVEIPTGVGFCMLIKRACLEETGPFDVEKFGRGYGEENDFCMRSAAKGWRHLLACDTFVFHEGGVSFSNEQAERIEKAQAVLDRLYPDYHKRVQQHILDDPAAPFRLRARVAMLRRSPRPRVLYVSHHLGGGTGKHVRELVEYLGDRMEGLLIEPVREGVVSLAFGTGDETDKLLFALPGDYAVLRTLLSWIGIARIHFHHTLALETSVWGLPADLGVPYDVTLHDYHFINGNPTQTDAKGFYRPTLEQDADNGLETDPETWRANQRPLLSGAERVIAPSAFTRDLYGRFYPDLNYRVARHPDFEQDAPYPPVKVRGRTDAEPLRVLVLGALSLEKGADLLEQTASQCREAGVPVEFSLAGYAYRPLSSGVRELGPYDAPDVGRIIGEVDPDLIWFPALWPETYSYTLSESLNAGRPLVVPDIGAFPERVAGRPCTWVVPWCQSIPEWVDFFERAAAELGSAATGGVHDWDQQAGSDDSGFYREAYLEPGDLAKPSQEEVLEGWQWLDDQVERSILLAAGDERRSRKERLLMRLVELRRGRLGRLATRLLPYRLQRRVKRWLSRKPLHELR